MTEEETAPTSDERPRSSVVDLFRRAASAGLGVVFMSEDNLRRAAAQLKIPKEVLGLFVAQAERTRDEVGRLISEELQKFLQSERLRTEAMKVLSGLTLDIHAEIKVVPDGGEPRVRAVVHKASIARKTRRRRR